MTRMPCGHRLRQVQFAIPVVNPIPEPETEYGCRNLTLHVTGGFALYPVSKSYASPMIMIMHIEKKKEGFVDSSAFFSLKH